MTEFLFAAASPEERVVFGAQRPGYSSRVAGSAAVHEWIGFMKGRGIRRVCCLLSKSQLSYYNVDLLKIYRSAFGQNNVCWAPVEDFHLCDKAVLEKVILPFLKESYEKSTPVVVHCSGGSGRTGHILAAWLTHGRGYAVHDALSSVLSMGKNPQEAIGFGNATVKDLVELLTVCQI